ncbi:hypothetical protein BKM31_38275 [[Actinomadura] parvosata subsp. kistnae]|uniref:Uncharacterized protein n=1 Tax=[Actinomadura] parvosata subsp. kistnae TaxID=1909395 RepID=A0A1V0A8M5_9ACTN|nr:hypothetical protein [Nonomuraea sp. ATCC 55076]AQZ66523.1 hypothetical protein BKM31_38275 [Nonomuraea sp. ATCC 55076]
MLGRPRSPTAAAVTAAAVTAAAVVGITDVGTTILAAAIAGTTTDAGATTVSAIVGSPTATAAADDAQRAENAEPRRTWHAGLRRVGVAGPSVHRLAGLTCRSPV